MSKVGRTPTADHPITVRPTGARVTVHVGDQVVADSTAALTLQEATYPAVQYVPLADVDAALLVRTDTSTYCPYKGDASYYTITTSAGDVVDAIWTYDQPYDAVADIAGHVAFYPSKVTISVG
ncbi:DUF427 domain-containing protein [Antrihabitans spumae]|uniref:DUF427 domain-containing protein n=1 Tax=Antrihabitans spumae TaxID=3373370 RepID=A0ABW7KT08_9NOCA